MGGDSHIRFDCAELCAGSAGLSCAVGDAGFDACSIDHRFNKHKPKMPIANFDLSSPVGQNCVLELLNSGRVFAVHIKPPCGTASRAKRNLCHAGLRIVVLRSLNHYAAKPSRVASEAFKA